MYFIYYTLCYIPCYLLIYNYYTILLHYIIIYNVYASKVLVCWFVPPLLWAVCPKQREKFCDSQQFSEKGSFQSGCYLKTVPHCTGFFWSVLLPFFATSNMPMIAAAAGPLLCEIRKGRLASTFTLFVSSPFHTSALKMNLCSKHTQVHWITLLGRHLTSHPELHKTRPMSLHSWVAYSEVK